MWVTPIDLSTKNTAIITAGILPEYSKSQDQSFQVYCPVYASLETNVLNANRGNGHNAFS